MIETHAHIDAEVFDEDRDAMIQHAFQAGVQAIIIPAIEPPRFNKVLQICNDWPGKIYCGMGIHPHHAAQVSDSDLAIVEDLAIKNKSVVAIGEAGLDYYYDFAPPDVQQYIFTEQIRLAKKLKLPIIIHNRESDRDMLRILEKEQDGTLQGVLHCFSSPPDILEAVQKLGMHISFTGNITYKKSVLDPVVQAALNDRIMIETDSPYMTPVPHRGKRNEPAYVRFIAEKIASIKGLTIQQVVDMTTHTSKKLFGLALSLLLFFVLGTAAYAQSTKDIADSTDEEEILEEPAAPPPNRFSRTFGIGLSAATNTIVETIDFLQRAGSRSTRSYEGILAFGGALGYNITDHFMVEAGYLYSRNNQPIIRGFSDNPNTHQIVNFTLRAVANPRSRVAFYAMAGPSFIFNRILGVSSSSIGLNAGAGFKIHIPTSFGMLMPVAEWRLDFDFNDQNRDLDIDPQYRDRGPVNVSAFFSLPRLTIYWYPDL
jgi:TatD DNase family protein